MASSPSAAPARMAPVECLIITSRPAWGDFGLPPATRALPLYGSLAVGFLRRNRAADLPVIAKRIDPTTDAPPMRSLARPDSAAPCGTCLCERESRARHSQEQLDGPAAQRLRAEVAVFRRLVA